MEPAPEEETERFEEAIRWLTRGASEHAEGPEADAFRQWLSSHPGNQDAWKSAREVYEKMGQRELWEEKTEERSTFDRKNLSPQLGLAAALVLIAGAAGWWMLQLNRGDTWETAAGEQRVVTLADGSVVDMDSGTRMIARIGSKGLRRITLKSGRIALEVSHDVSRPFRVHTGHAVVEVTGTRFQVADFGEEVGVSVLNGSVEVSAAAQPDHPSTLKDLQRVTVESSGRLSAIETIEASTFASWRDGVIDFRNERLSSVLNEVERYTGRQVILEERELKGLRVSGSFSTADPMSFIEALPYIAPVEVMLEGDVRVMIRSREAPPALP